MHPRVRSSVSLFLSLALLIMLAGPALAVTPAPGSPGLSLGRELSGENAVRVLGADLAKVAAAHGKTTAALAKALRSDKRLIVDPTGALFYREAPADTPLGAPVPVDAITTGAAADPADAFSLHSNPNSKRVLYLDFDGHTLSGTVWNTNYNGGADIIAPAWDVEGGAAVFTVAERTTIAQIWARVSEDYAPFDVDVTTEYPGEDRMTRSSFSDEYFGVRALISPISSYFGPYGGIAYVGVFDHTSDTYKPALIFPERLANGEKNIAEACSHEVGHTLGLLHDGTTAGTEYYPGHGAGETGWAPIMGSSYQRNVTQWSRGEYAGANNTEDDLAVIQANGLTYRVDDHANTAAGATELVPEPGFAASGIINRAGDTDTMTMTVGSGEFSASVVPASRGSNLDIALDLRTADGTLVASAQPAATLAASLTTVVASGTYSLSIRGVGTGNPTTGYSDYASFGAWTLTGTAVPSDVTSGEPIPLEHDAAGVTLDRWVTGYSTAYSGGGYVYSRWAGTRLDAKFTGDSISWIGPKQPAYGMADVYIDGVLAASNVDCYAAAPGTLSATIWQSATLADGPHTISIRLTGAKNAASTGNVVVVDRFEVTGAAPAGGGNRIDACAALPGSTGTWITAANPTYYNQTYRYSRWVGAALTATFNGTRVAWIGPKTPNYGMAEVWIDDVMVATVDQYKPNLAAQGWREVVWESGLLAPGAHTVQIRPTGTMNPASTAANIVIDALDVMP